MPIIDDSNFELPSEKDFYMNAVDDTYLKMISDTIDKTDKDEQESTAEAANNVLKAAFYTETPATTDLGYHPDLGVYFVKVSADLNEKIQSIGGFDGDTMPCTLVNAGDTETEEFITNNVKKKLSTIYGDTNRFSVRFLGVDTPEIYHYSYEKVNLSGMSTVTKNFSEIKNNSNYIYERAANLEETSGTFIKLPGKDKWFRYTVVSKDSDETEIKVLNDAGQHKFDDSKYETGLKAQQAVVKAVNMANGEIYAMLDANSLNMSNDKYPTWFDGDPFSSGVGNNMAVLAEKLLNHSDYVYTYYSAWGMDAYGRFLGTIYLKINDNWINLTKYVIAACSDTNDLTILPSFEDSPSTKANNNYASNTFKLWTYDFADRNYADAIASVSAQFDDREEIQAKIFGKSLDSLKKWTVMIGDNMFIVPPTSIRCVTNTTSERVPVMRARGTMAKSSDKAERIIELTLFFNGDKGVNGIPIECEEAKKGGDKVTYYFNGLRPLIAMFKFTPFLPIENEYINKVLNIDAVTMYNMKSSLVHGYPGLISVTLQMAEFNYRVYMPEMPVNYHDDKFINYFAAGINFKTMRYYYQRAILRGNLAATKPEMLDKGEKAKTQLKPMNFKSSLVKFEIADENQLKKKMQAYQMALTKPGAKIVLTDAEKQLAKDLGSISAQINEILSSDKYKEIISNTANKNLFKRQSDVEKIAKLMRGISNVTSIKVDDVSEKYYNLTKRIYAVVLNVSFDYITDESEYANLKKMASAASSVNATPESFFNNMQILIPYNTSAAPIELDTSVNYDINFINYCSVINSTDGTTMNEEAQNINNASDWERYDSLKYTYWDAGNIFAESMSIALGNTLSRITVSGTDGYAPQYLGGQDTIINLSFKTQNQLTVSMVQLLPKICAYYMRTYRQVLTAAPIRISSEFTDFFSVKEVTIENVNVETVEKTPGLYEITMSLKSIDRTIRNKEAMHRIEGTDNGSLNSVERTKINVNSYFDLNKKIAQAELYPDLELPTLEELNKKNFYFIRYIIDNNRVYVDPDFYFVYAYILSSQVYREAILRGVTEDNEDYILKDSGGGEVTLKTSNNKLYAEKTADTQAFRTIKDAKRFKENNNKTKADKRGKLNKKVDTLTDDVQFWSVSPNITVSFLEKEYAAQIQNHQDNNTVGNDEVEGTWANNIAMESDKAAEAIIEYLGNNPIKTDGLKKIISGDKQYYTDISYDVDAFKSHISSTVAEFFSRGAITSILNQINIDITNSDFKTVLPKIIEACACAASSKNEYTGSEASDGWKPRREWYKINESDVTNESGGDMRFVTDFGAYGIKILSAGEYALLSGFEAGDSSYYSQYVLDPYYNQMDASTFESYKYNCIHSLSYSTEAFCRLTLFWLARLLKQRIIPSIVLSMLRGDVKKEVDNLNIIDNALNTKDDMLKQYKAIIKSAYSFDAGIIFLSSVMALVNGDEQIMALYRKRDYTAFKQMARACSSPLKNIDPRDTSGIRLRKLMLALCGIGEISDYTRIGLDSSKEQNSDKIKNIEQAYIEAASNPKQYWLDSFMDMIQYDHRGRMLRAFPVYYILMIDEGRSFGQWKLHDNFYNTSSIIEMQIAKSRKNPADTAHIVMTNVYGSYSTTDEDSNAIYDTDYWDLWTSIWSPDKLYKREEARRSVSNPTEKTKLTPGIRVNIRLGYGANAVTLPTVFNGVIAEVRPGETIDLVCQGDGIELMNPVVENQDMYEMMDQDLAFGVNILDNGATPKEIMNTMLTAKGGWWNKQIASWDTRFSYLFKKNPYGIVHFGDAGYTDIFKSGEPTQNIYEVTDKPVNSGINWGQGEMDAQFMNRFSFNEFDKADAEQGPKLTFDVFGKTTWDIFNICKSSDPDYILGVAPFGFRSTVFMGRPRYYYAYDYIDDNGTILEKRKPYQQYHIYSSFTDIIQNGIHASSKNIKTCATGTYTRKESFGTSSTQKVGPMWVDCEIYPECQKTMVVDTTLVGEGIPIVGQLPFVNRIVDRFSDDKGTVQSPYRIAWKMTASSLKQSMKDMYTGELIVLGDPSVKPLDRMFITDAYENISGQCEVKEVVQMISVNNGYTTAIVPDLIAVVDDKYEIANQTVGAKLASTACAAVGIGIGTGSLYAAGFMFNGKGFTPSTSMTKKTLEGVAKYAAKGAEALKNSTGVVAKIGSSLAKVAASAGITAGAVAAAPALITVAIELAIYTAIEKTVMSGIERYAENLQIMTVFPLKRNGKTMTAGMLGSKGCIYGSPSYNDPGLIKSIFANIATPDTVFGKALNAIFSSDDLNVIGQKYSRDAGVTDENGNNVTDAKASDSMCKAVLAANAYDLTGYEKFLLQPRIKTKQEMHDAYNNGAITDVKNIESNQRICSENIMVSRSSEIKPFIDNNFFRIVHEDSGFDNNDNAYPMKQTINGEVVQFNAIRDTDAKGNEVYDIPFLKQDAISVLAEILKRSYDACPSINMSDSNNRSTGSFITLKSALRVGDQSTIASMGYSFVIAGLGECSDAMNITVKNMIQEIKDKTEDKDNKVNPLSELFAYYSIDGNTIGVSVKPPVISRDVSDSTEEYDENSEE